MAATLGTLLTARCIPGPIRQHDGDLLQASLEEELTGRPVHRNLASSLRLLINRQSPPASFTVLERQPHPLFLHSSLAKLEISLSLV
jgi:hypothetical protein